MMNSHRTPCHRCRPCAGTILTLTTALQPTLTTTTQPTLTLTVQSLPTPALQSLLLMTLQPLPATAPQPLPLPPACANRENIASTPPPR